MISQFTIHNEFLEVTIKRKGAELCSVRDKYETEFMWQAGKVWERHAPNLFPIVGSLLDHEYTYEGEYYKLTHHGFARNLEFDMLHQSEHSICLILQQSEDTLLSYPFQFSLLMTYRLDGPRLTQTFRVINDSKNSIPVSFGGHPAFNASPISEYEIVFSESENIQSNVLVGPYIGKELIDVIDGNTITLDNHTFDNDALIFQGLKSKTVSLCHKTSGHSVEVDISEFPYLGIWAKPGAHYVCIEPWQGLADYTNHTKELINKTGIVIIEEGGELERGFTMTFTSPK